MKKRLISVLLSLAITVGVVPLHADAQTITMADNIVVGGIALKDGDYLLEGESKAKSGTPPSEADYAYMVGHTLYLKNFDLTTHNENKVDSDTTVACCIGLFQFCDVYYDDEYLGSLINDFDVTIHLEGKNTISDSTSEYSIYTHRDSGVLFEGDGTLEMNRPIGAAAGLNVNGGNIQIAVEESNDAFPLIGTSDFTMNNGVLSLQGGNRTGIRCDGTAAFYSGSSTVVVGRDAVECSQLNITNDIVKAKFISTATGTNDQNYFAVYADNISLPSKLNTIVSQNADASDWLILPKGSTSLDEYDFVGVGLPGDNISGTVSGVDITTITTVELYKSGLSVPMETMTVTGNNAYAFSVFEEGDYTIKASADGYLPYFKSVAFTSDTASITSDIEMEKFDFRSLSPVPSESELTAGFTDLGEAKLGSDATNLMFYGFPKKLSDSAIEAGTTVSRGIRVYRNDSEFYSRTYQDNEVFGWNLKENITDGGEYRIEVYISITDGDAYAEKKHTYTIYVIGSTVDYLEAFDLETPIVGKEQPLTATCNIPGVYIYDIEWCYFDETEDDIDWQWPIMQEGDVFEAGERYQVVIEFRTEEGFSFTETSDGMTAYINGVEATVVWNPYATNKAYVELEFTPLEMGDINADGNFNVTDAVALQKWLVCAKGAEKSIVEWKAGNFINDDKLNVFDICLMKRELINK
jgi:hypothetical protein